MTRRKNRFAGPPTVGEIRESQRADARPFNDDSVYLPNPSADAPFDRRQPLSCEEKSYASGFRPLSIDGSWQLVRGDSGAGKSAFRTAELFQNLGGGGARLSGTPYSQAIALATMRSSDQRPRFFQANLFSVGRLFQSPIPSQPLSSSESTRFAPGIPAGTASIAGTTQFGIPTVSTTQFRIMVSDESGQRYQDFDVVGTRSVILYGFGVTVFALIKADGYEIDRSRNDNPSLGPGLLDQSVVGSRIIPMRTVYSAPISNRTTSIISTGNNTATVMPIPPGSRRVQIYVDPPDPSADLVNVSFSNEDLLNVLTAASPGRQGVIDFPAPGNRSSIYNIPNSNSILIQEPAATPSRIWTFVFEATP